MICGCIASPGFGYILSGFVHPRGCSHRVHTAFVFASQEAGFSNWTNEGRPGANRPGAHTVDPAGLHVASQCVAHVWLGQSLDYGLFNWVIFWSRLAPLHYLTHHQRCPGGTPRCLRMMPKMCWDCLCRSLRLTVYLQEHRWSACLPLLRWRPTILMGTRDYCQRF